MPAACPRRGDRQAAMLDRETFFSYSWDRTPLGPVAGWSNQLEHSAAMLLASKQPMFLLWGSQRTFIFNAAYEEIWQSPWPDLLGKPMAEVVGAAWSLLGPMVERVFAGESFIEKDFAISRGEGFATRYVDFSYTPVRDWYSKAIVAALCICSDVTEEVAQAESNRQEREILALTVENVTEGVALVAPDLSFVLWNEQFLEHFGYDPAEISMGMNAAELIMKSALRGDLGPGDPQAIAEGLAHSIRSTESADFMISSAAFMPMLISAGS